MATPQGHPETATPRPGARVLLVNAEQQILLMRGFDPSNPGVRYWFTVGGGVDPGETRVQAAARELWEETGLAVPPERLGDPVWHEVVEFPFNGRRYRQEQEYFLLRVPHWDVRTDGWAEIERRTVDQVRWWGIEELESSEETYYPRVLPALLRRVLGAHSPDGRRCDGGAVPGGTPMNESGGR